MDVYYVNHLNERIDLDSENIILQYQELFDYSWDCETANNKISGFYRDSVTIPVTVTVTADTDQEYFEVLEEFYSVIAKDIESVEPGRLYLGNQYLECYISGDLKKDAFMGVPIQVKNLTIVTDRPLWVCENSYTFHSYVVSSSDNKRYAGRYPYRYANGLSNTYIQNPHFTDANFSLAIYGPVVNPQVSIGGQNYLVNIILEEGERLEIDSRTETITKIMATGERVNAFHNREKGKAFFRKIPPGRQPVSWAGGFDWDLMIYEERSEPKWSSQFKAQR